jgi:phosphoenolpyruvate phosphomutase
MSTTNGDSLVAALLAARAKQTPLRGIGTPNALAARVAVESGFEVLWVSGLEVAVSLGIPDENVLTVRDLVDVVMAIRRVTNQHVMVDIDNGGGGIQSAARLARDLSLVGATALSIEDSYYPKVNSFSLRRRQRLGDARLLCDQLIAVRQVVDSQVVLVARTEALICGERIEVALARAARYVASGADAVLIHSKEASGSQALAVAEAWPLPVPLVTVPTAFEHVGLDQLGKAGFALAVYANQLTRASFAAMRDAGRFFAEGPTGDHSRKPPKLADIQDLLNSPGSPRTS